VDGLAGVELTFTGTYVAWVAPGADGCAQVSVLPEVGGEVILSEFSGRRQIVFQHTFTSVGVHTISISTLCSPGTLPVDGFIVR
jgi:hypothetical protein